MTKEELVFITLGQLLKSFKASPENFRLEDPAVSPTSTNGFPGPTIIWQYKVMVGDNQFMIDPLNSVKTMIITYNKFGRELTCYIYNREVNSPNQAIMPDAKIVLDYSDFWPACFHRTHRQFMSIRSGILKRNEDKEYADYLRRLNAIFPGTHEEDIFQ